MQQTLVLLLRRGEVAAERRNALRRLLPYLEAVKAVPPSSIRWDTLTYHRANAEYRLLLGVCELVVRGLLPTQDVGDAKLHSWLSDEAMSNLYENFLREYYALHHPELSPPAAYVAWDLGVDDARGAQQLPGMRTDVTLRSGNRTLIIDAKYYSQSMQINLWGKATVHSANLYQVSPIRRTPTWLAMVRSAACFSTRAPTRPDSQIWMSSFRVTGSVPGHST